MPLPATDRTLFAQELIMRKAFAAHWCEETPIVSDNVKLPNNAPSDGWIKWNLSYTPGLSGQWAVGTEPTIVYRRQGLIIVQCFVSSGSGMERLAALVEKALNYFEEVEPPAGVWYENQGPSPGTDDGKWYSRNVTTNFIYDVLRQRTSA